MLDNHELIGGFDPSKKYDFVSWDDDIPNIWKVIKAMFQTTNQRILFFPAYHCLVGGFDPSKKYEFVSWDDDIPNIMESHKSHVPNHQPANIQFFQQIIALCYLEPLAFPQSHDLPPGQDLAVGRGFS